MSDRLFTPLWRGLGLGERRLSVHAGSHGLAACWAPKSRSGSPDAAFFPWGEEGSSPGALKKLWDSKNWPKAGWTLSLPVAHGVFRRMNVPAVAPKEIRDILALQALRQLPLSPQEMVTDYLLLRQDPKGVSEVLMGVLLREELDKALMPFREAGLEPGRILPAVLSLANAVGRESGTGTWVHEEEGTSVFVEKRGGTLERLGVSPRQENPGFAEPVVRLPESPRPEIRLAEGAFASEPEGANFLPPDLQRSLERNAGRGKILAASALAGGILLVLGILHAQTVAWQKKRLEAIKIERAGHALQVRRLSSMSRELELLRGEKTEGRGLPRFLQTLESTLPKGLSLETLSYDREKGVTLQGAAFTFARAVEAVNALDASGRFGKVELRSSNASRLHGRDIVQFQIECLWKEEPAQ